MKPLIINSFFGGISDGSRKPTDSEFQISKHFDIFTDPKRLIPYRSLEADTNDGSTATGMKQYLVRDFVYATGSTKLYGLGQTAAGLTKIVEKADATTGNWSLPATSEGNGAVKNGCFYEYKDYLWGFQGTNQIFRWGLLSGTPAITNSQGTVGATITSVANGVIAADGNAYMAYNNVIVRVGTTLVVTDSVKTVPDNFKITSLSNYGSYLAIGCSPKNAFNGQSKVFIWNLSSDLFYETIDWGDGELRVLEMVEGVLVGITDRYLNNSVGAGRGSMVVQIYQGGAAQVFKEIFTKSLTGKTIPTTKVVQNGRLFWSAKIMTNTTGTEYHEGLWSFGRKNSQYPFAMTLDVVDQSANTLGIQGFGSAANYFFIAHSNDGSISKTDDSATFTNTSSYESQIYNFGDTTVSKKFDTITIYTSSIPAGGVATLKFRADGATAWTTVGSFSTTGGMSRDFYNIESTGADFASFKEVEIRIESTGNVEPTGFKLVAIPLIGSN